MITDNLGLDLVEVLLIELNLPIAHIWYLTHLLACGVVAEC